MVATCAYVYRDFRLDEDITSLMVLGDDDCSGATASVFTKTLNAIKASSTGATATNRTLSAPWGRAVATGGLLVWSLGWLERTWAVPAVGKAAHAFSRCVDSMPEGNVN